MPRLCLSGCLLIILLFSICILQSRGKGGGGGGGRGGGVWISPHRGLSDRRSSRGTVQLGVLGYYVWGSLNSQSSKRGYSNSHEYPFLTSRKEKYSPSHLSQEDLERMPKHYRRIVESGGHLDDFKEYYLSDLYEQDMDQVAAERRELIDRFGSYERSTQSSANSFSFDGIVSADRPQLKHFS